MNIKTVINWADLHQGLLAIIIFLTGSIFGIIKWIIDRSQKDKVPYINSGGDIKCGGDIVVGNKTLIQKSAKNCHNIQGENINLTVDNSEK